MRSPERATHLRAVEFADACASLACANTVAALANSCNFRIWLNHAPLAELLAYAMVALGAVGDGRDVILERARVAHEAGPYQGNVFDTPEDGEIADFGRLYILCETSHIVPDGQ